MRARACVFVRFCAFAFLLVCARVLGVYVYLLAFLLVRTFDTVCWRVLVPGNGTADRGATAIAAALAANRTLTSVDLAGASWMRVTEQRFHL